MSRLTSTRAVGEPISRTEDARFVPVLIAHHIHNGRGDINVCDVAVACEEPQHEKSCLSQTEHGPMEAE